MKFDIYETFCKGQIFELFLRRAGSERVGSKEKYILSVSLIYLKVLNYGKEVQFSAS